MSDWLVIDANVIVKAFVAEPDSQAAELVWASDFILAAPAHALAEVGEVLRRKRSRGEIAEQQQREIARFLPGSFTAIGLDRLFEPAMEISSEVSQSFYDCLYLAAAESWDCLMVTADERFVDAVAKTSLRARVHFLHDFAARLVAQS